MLKRVKTVAQAARLLGRSREGAMATWLAVSLVPLLVSAGMASDIARAYALRSEISSALDAAALAGGRVFNDDNRDTIIQQYFDANFPENFMDSTLGPLQITEITDQDGPDRIQLSIEADMPTLFMRLIGIDTFDVSSDSEVTRENLGLQLVMVLDHTGSMDGSKIADLESASLSLLDIVFGDETVGEHELLSVGVVPYSAAVNVGDLGDAFIDRTNIPAQIFSNGNDDRRWKGCVQARQTLTTLDPDPTVLDPGAFDISVEGPATGGRWRPYLYPHWYDNQYNQLPFADDMDPTDPGQNAGSNIDGVSDAFAYRQGKGPYGEIWPLPDTNPSLGNRYTGPNIGCPARVLPLSNEYSVIRSYLQDNTIAWSRGGTIASQGLVWGWRMLHPEAPFENDVPYNDPGTFKAMILMTDGENQIWQLPLDQYAFLDSRENVDPIFLQDIDGDGNVSEDENGNGIIDPNEGDTGDMPESDYTAYGRLDDARLGTTNVNTAKARINQRMLKICNAMKAGGILGRDRVTVYTVIFGNVATSGSQSAQDLRELYRNCASRPSNAFLATSGFDLREAFETIGNDLSNLRISR